MTLEISPPSRIGPMFDAPRERTYPLRAEHRFFAASDCAKVHFVDCTLSPCRRHAYVAFAFEFVPRCSHSGLRLLIDESMLEQETRATSSLFNT